MKGISSLLIVALVASVYGDSLEKSEWEALEKLRQENASRKEKVLSFLREIGKEQPTANEKYNEILSRSKNREIENDDRNIEKWRPGIPPNILSLIKKYKQNSPNGHDPCKGDQTKNQKKDDSDDLKDSEDSNVDIDGENSDRTKEESPTKNRGRRSTSRKDESSSDEDDSNSIDNNSSEEELRRSHRGKGKPKEKNPDESNSDEKSNNDSDEKDSRGSRKDKPKKKHSDESNSDDKSDDSESDEEDCRDSREDKLKKKNSDVSDSDNKSGDSDSNKSDSKGKNSPKKKHSDESNSDNSNDSADDKKNSKKRRENKSKEKDSDESNSDDKSDDSDSNKSKTDEDDESENSSEEKKWRWILNRGHRASNKTSAPWNWQPNTIWELEAKRAELKSRLIGIVQLEKVIKFLKNRTDECKKRGQWERMPGLIKATAVHKKLLAENINAVSRICNITEVGQSKISDLIIKCAINYSPQWRKSPHAGRPILESKKAILNNDIPLQEFLAAHRDLNRIHLTQILNAKGLVVKEGEQVNGIISWKSQPDKSAPPSDNAGAIQEEISLNSSDNRKNGPASNVDEPALLDKDQAPETSPKNGKEGNGSKNLNDQSGPGSQLQSKPESSSAGGNGVNPSNNENEIPGSNDNQPANDANQPPQSVPKSDKPENLDLKTEVSSSSDNTAKVVAIADNNSSRNRKKSINDINNLGDLNQIAGSNFHQIVVDQIAGSNFHQIAVDQIAGSNFHQIAVDQIAGSATLTELSVRQAESSTPENETDKGQNKSSTDSNNQTTADNQTDTTLGNNEASDDTSSQTGSTTSQTEQSSEISENTDTEPTSSSALSTDGTTATIQNASSESESIFNTTPPKSTSLIDE